MPRTKDYKKLAEKLQKEVIKLKKRLKNQFQKGIDFAYKEAEKIHAAYEKHIKNAVMEIHKKFKTKPKKAVSKKAITKKGIAKTAKAKGATPAKRRGGPAKKKGVTKSE